MPVRLGVAIAAGLVGAILGAFSLIAARAGAGFSFAGESLWGAAILLIPGLAMFGVGAIYLSRRSGLVLGLLLSSDRCCLVHRRMGQPSNQFINCLHRWAVVVRRLPSPGSSCGPGLPDRSAPVGS